MLLAAARDIALRLQQARPAIHGVDAPTPRGGGPRPVHRPRASVVRNKAKEAMHTPESLMR